MYVIRPIALRDLDNLKDIAFQAAPGMISLPKDKDLLREKIAHSMLSFERTVARPGDEIYFFVLEDNGVMGGCCGIYAKTGETYPNYFFQVRTLNTKSDQVRMKGNIKVLDPIVMRHGPTELCGLYLLHELRKEGLGQLLSLSRFLFIANNRDRFDSAIMARLRGFITKNKNNSPFWDGTWSHFVETNFIDTLNLLERTQDFIPDILPDYPLYISLLPKNAQLAIDRTHTATRPALKMLNKQGLKQVGLVDLFDAGPVLMGKMDDVKTIQNSKLGTVEDISREPIMSGIYVVCNTKIDFRACYARIKKKSGNIVLEKQAADALHVEAGDQVRFIKL